MKAEFYAGFPDLPESYLALFRKSEEQGFYHSEAWYRAQLATTQSENDKSGFIGVATDGGEPVAILPVRWPRRTRDGFLWSRICQNYTNLYSSQSALIADESVAADPEVADTLVAAILENEMKPDVLLFDRLAPESAFFRNLEASMKRRRLATERFFNFGNWYEPIGDRSFETYAAARKKGVVRDCRRRHRKFEKDFPEGGFKIYRNGPDLEDYFNDFKNVYKASWKPDERFPDFIDRVVAEAAKNGAVRISLLTTGDEVIAARLSFCQGGVASLFKTAYRRDYKKYSPGLLMHWLMIRDMIENEELREVEFGNGDEPHKADWASRRREFWGIAGKNPARPLGRANIILQQVRSMVRAK